MTLTADVLSVRSYPIGYQYSEGDSSIRAHVVDSLERVYMGNHDYTPVRDRLLRGSAPGVIHFDWDVVVSREGLHHMRARARANPGEPFVVPYRLYPQGVWAHRDARGEPLTDFMSNCWLPAFGAIYLPRNLAAGFTPPANDPRMTGTNFAAWANNQGVVWLVDWQVQAIHLHW